MHERKDKYRYFDMKFDSAKDLEKKKTVLGQNFITKKSSNSSPPFALSVS